MTDEEHLDAVANARDVAAFEALVRRHRRRVRDICLRRLGHDADAEDAVQDVFRKLLESAGAIEGNLAGWLARCARNTCVDLIRRRVASRQREASAARDESWNDRALSRLETVEFVQHLLAQLPEDERDLLLKHLVERVPQRELAAQRGVSQQAVARKLARMKRRMRSWAGGHLDKLSIGGAVVGGWLATPRAAVAAAWLVFRQAAPPALQTLATPKAATGAAAVAGVLLVMESAPHDPTPITPAPLTAMRQAPGPVVTPGYTAIYAQPPSRAGRPGPHRPGLDAAPGPGVEARPVFKQTRHWVAVAPPRRQHVHILTPIGGPSASLSRRTPPPIPAAAPTADRLATAQPGGRASSAGAARRAQHERPAAGAAAPRRDVRPDISKPALAAARSLGAGRTVSLSARRPRPAAVLAASPFNARVVVTSPTQAGRAADQNRTSFRGVIDRAVLNLGEVTLSDAVIAAPFKSPRGSRVVLKGTNFFNGPTSGAGALLGDGTAVFNALHSPGDSPAVVEVAGDVAYTDQARLLIELAGLEEGEYDRLEIAGSLALDGDLEVALLDGFQTGPGQRFAILQALGGVTGRFDNLIEGQRIHVPDNHGPDLFITYLAGHGNAVELFTLPSAAPTVALPEPTTLTALVLGSWTLLRRGRKDRIK